MAQDPAFLFYTADFIVGTITMNDDQVGKYVKLLCLQHQQKGKLSEEDMLKICKTHDKDIFSKFTYHDDGYYYNKRLSEEVNKRNNFTNSRRNNRLGKNKLKKTETHDEHMFTHDEHMFTHDEHMENEIIISNSNSSNNDGLFNGIKLSNNVNNDISNNINNDVDKHMKNTSSTHEEHMFIATGSAKRNEKISDIGHYPIEHLLEVYFSSNSLIRTREQVAMKNQMDISMLRDWAEAFNRFLICDGVVEKIKVDWQKHFNNWLTLQDKNQNPQNLFNQNHTEKNKNNGKKPHQNGPKNFNEDYKRELLAKMAQRPS